MASALHLVPPKRRHPPPVPFRTRLVLLRPTLLRRPSTRPSMRPSRPPQTPSPPLLMPQLAHSARHLTLCQRLHRMPSLPHSTPPSTLNRPPSQAHSVRHLTHCQHRMGLERRVHLHRHLMPSLRRLLTCPRVQRPRRQPLPIPPSPVPPLPLYQRASSRLKRRTLNQRRRAILSGHWSPHK